MRVIVSGKGGVGKSTVTALLVLALRGRRPLIVDADPVGRLGRLLGVTPRGTVAAALEPLADQRGVDRVALSAQAVREILTPVPGVGTLLAMGQHHREGCFCTLNRLLKLAVDAVAGEFSLVLMDAEGGIEHVNRATAGRVDALIVVAEPTVNALDVAFSVAGEAQARLAPDRLCLVLNRTRPGGSGGEYLEWLARWQHALVTLPYSDHVAGCQASGAPLLDTTEDVDLQEALGALASWVDHR